MNMSFNNVKTILLILIVSFIIAAIVLYGWQFSKYLPEKFRVEEPEITEVSKLTEEQKFDLEKAKLLPLLQATPSASVKDSALPRQQQFILGKAKIIYRPLSNEFEGQVEAGSLEEYRQEKKALINYLQDAGINLCSLNVYWSKPDNIPKEDFPADDYATLGCD